MINSCKKSFAILLTTALLTPSATSYASSDPLVKNSANQDSAVHILQKSIREYFGLYMGPTEFNLSEPLAERLSHIYLAPPGTKDFQSVDKLYEDNRLISACLGKNCRELVAIVQDSSNRIQRLALTWEVKYRDREGKLPYQLAKRSGSRHALVFVFQKQLTYDSSADQEVINWIRHLSRSGISVDRVTFLSFSSETPQ